MDSACSVYTTRVSTLSLYFQISVFLCGFAFKLHWSTLHDRCGPISSEPHLGKILTLSQFADNVSAPDCLLTARKERYGRLVPSWHVGPQRLASTASILRHSPLTVPLPHTLSLSLSLFLQFTTIPTCTLKYNHFFSNSNHSVIS